MLHVCFLKEVMLFWGEIIESPSKRKITFYHAHCNVPAQVEEKHDDRLSGVLSVTQATQQ